VTKDEIDEARREYESAVRQLAEQARALLDREYYKNSANTERAHHVALILLAAGNALMFSMDAECRVKIPEMLPGVVSMIARINDEEREAASPTPPAEHGDAQSGGEPPPG